MGARPSGVGLVFVRACGAIVFEFSERLQKYKQIYRTKNLKPGAQAQKAEGVRLFKLAERYETLRAEAVKMDCRLCADA